MLGDQASGVDESFTQDIGALAMAYETSAIPALIGMDDTPLISIYPGTVPETQRALLEPYRDGGFYFMTIGEHAESLLKYLNGSNFRLGGDIRRTRANFINSDDWLYAFELTPLPSYDEASGLEVLTASVLSADNPSFEWKLPANGKRAFEAYFGPGTSFPMWARNSMEVITDIFLCRGEETELLTSYTITPGAMLSKIRLELSIPEGDCALRFEVRPISGSLYDAPWSVMLVQPELIA